MRSTLCSMLMAGVELEEAGEAGAEAGAGAVALREAEEADDDGAAEDVDGEGAEDQRQAARQVVDLGAGDPEAGAGGDVEGLADHGAAHERQQHHDQDAVGGREEAGGQVEADQLDVRVGGVAEGLEHVGGEAAGG